MRAILGCLLMVTGPWLGVATLLSSLSPGIGGWTACAFLVLLGLLLLGCRPGPAAPRDERACRTCRGGGTVYSEEYNDWRRAGPIPVIRELCPGCQGSGVTLSPAGRTIRIG